MTNKRGRPPLHESGTAFVGTSQPKNLVDNMLEIARIESSDESKTWRLAATRFVENWKKENPGVLEAR